jgi:hypothetical protein
MFRNYTLYTKYFTDLTSDIRWVRYVPDNTPLANLRSYMTPLVNFQGYAHDGVNYCGHSAGQ